MSELEVQKYVPELDHYLSGVDYHLFMEIHIDKLLLDRYKESGKDLIDHQEYNMVHAFAETIKEKKLDDRLVQEDTMFNGYPIRKLSANIWVFSKKELEQFKEEVRAEALSGK